MTREEQITQFAELETTLCRRISNDYGCALEEGIIIGAKWADENPKEGMVSIDKACEYLESAIRPYMGYCATCDFANDFRKAVEK